MRCLYTNAFVSFDDYPHLFIRDLSEVEVVTIDNNKVETKPYSTNGGCAENILRIDRIEKKVYKIRKTISMTGKCDGEISSNEELIMRLGNLNEKQSALKNNDLRFTSEWIEY